MPTQQIHGNKCDIDIPASSNNNDGDNDVIIRPIKSDEIKRLIPWITKEAGWTTNDPTFLKICQETDPDGFLVATDHSNGTVGTVLSMNMNNAYSFAGLYLVSKAYRAKGIGKVLWGKMLAHASHRCLGINSVQNRVAANLKMGFAEPRFKLAIFNGTLNRNAKLLDLKCLKERFSNLIIPSDKLKFSGQNPSFDDAKTRRIYDYEYKSLESSSEHGQGDGSNEEDAERLQKLKERSRVICERSADLRIYKLHYRNNVRDNCSHMLYLMDGADVDYNSLRSYDKAIHAGMPRDKFLKTFILLSTEDEYKDKVRCIVALNKKRGSIGDNKTSELPGRLEEESTVCGYGIIRPRATPEGKTDKFMAVAPLYADNALVANLILVSLIESIDKSSSINLEITVPFKESNDNNEEEKETVGLNFLYEAATKELGLKPEIECYRMYQNNILEKFKDGTLYNPDNDDKGAKAAETGLSNGSSGGSNIGNLDGKDDSTIKQIPEPDIPLDKIYTIVSSDIYLD